MSTLVYAQHIRCDWPECQSEVTIELPASGRARVMPAGWVDLRPYILRFDGVAIGELCSIHARATVEQLAALLKGPTNG